MATSATNGGTPIEITSHAQWEQILRNHSIVVSDFWADYCAPCKAFRPTYDSLSRAHSRPRKIAFVTVDTQSPALAGLVAREAVRALPTFKIFRGGQEWKVIKGGGPALGQAVDEALRLPDAKKPALAGQGRTLGGAPRAGLRRPIMWDLNKFLAAVVAFFGLYFTSLFSLDPYMAAMNSQFNVNAAPPSAPIQPAPSGGAAAARGPAKRATFKTLADLGQE